MIKIDWIQFIRDYYSIHAKPWGWYRGTNTDIHNKIIVIKY